MDVLQQVENGTLSPSEARTLLAAMDETPESITGKSDELLDAANRLRSPNAAGPPAHATIQPGESEPVVREGTTTKIGEAPAAPVNEAGVVADDRPSIQDFVPRIELSEVQMPHGPIPGQKPPSMHRSRHRRPLRRHAMTERAERRAVEVGRSLCNEDRDHRAVDVEGAGLIGCAIQEFCALFCSAKRSKYLSPPCILMLAGEVSASCPE